MTDYGLVYGATRERITTLVRDLDEAGASTPVAACPGWTVHDVIAHFAGSVTDALTGTLEGAGTDAWTGAQVEARRNAGMADLLDEWTKGATEFEDGLRLLGMPLAGLVISDAFQHEQDVRAALGVHGGRDLELMLVTIETCVTGLTGRVAGAGLAPLRVVAGTHEFVAGDGDPAVSVTAEPFELARAFGGRRTVDEMRALDWSGDPDPYLGLLSGYGMPAEPLGER